MRELAIIIKQQSERGRGHDGKLKKKGVRRKRTAKRRMFCNFVFCCL